MRTRWLPAVAVCLLAGGCQVSSGLEWQGWIEADLLFLGPDDSGRLVELAVVEGQQVGQGAPLFSIDTALQSADEAAARAGLAQAVARLARLTAAQQRPQEIAVIQATQKQARAALDFSTSELERTRALASHGNATKQQLDQAQSNFDRDTAALENAARQIDVARLSSRQEDIDAAQDAVDQAKAQWANAQARLARAKVAAPAAGRIEEVYYRLGEVVPPGKPVVSLLPPGNIKVRFFVPETSLARVKPETFKKRDMRMGSQHRRAHRHHVALTQQGYDAGNHVAENSRFLDAKKVDDFSVVSVLSEYGVGYQGALPTSRQQLIAARKMTEVPPVQVLRGPFHTDPVTGTHGSCERREFVTAQA